MANILFSPNLQAPINLANPTGALTLASDPIGSASQHNPVPSQGSVSLIGLAVKLALAMATNSGAVSVTGNSAGVTRQTVTKPAMLTGAVTATGAAPTLAVTSGAPVLTFPRIALVGNGGDQSYGSNATNGFPQWTTAAAGNAANVAIQTIGAYDLALLAGIFEGWDTNGSRDRENLVQALLKNGTYSVKLNNSRPTLTFFYHIQSEGNPSASGTGYDQLITQVNLMNGWLYESAGGTGTKTPSAFGNGAVLMNYSTAWPGAVGSAQPGESIVGRNYGSTSNGPTGAQGMARMNGTYAADKLLIKGATGDTRWTFNAQMAAPSAAGIVLDNAFAALDGAGTVPNSYLDGINSFPGGQTGGGFPALDTAQPLLARGIHNFFDQMQIMVSTYGTPGKIYYNFANAGQYANKYQFGTGTLTIGLENTLHGMLLEDTVGAGVPSWEYQFIGRVGGGANWGSGWINLLANYYQGMDFCLAPKMVVLGIRLPSSGTPSSWVNGGGQTLTSVTFGSALEYQEMRYGLCTALLDDGYFGVGVSGYDWAGPRWYDEYGDDSLTQVNVKRGYLGSPLTVRPTTATWAQGTMGVWSRSFTNGIAIVNPRGNGAQTVALSGTYTKLVGTQQPSINNGASVTSISLADGDGIILLGPVGTDPRSLPLADPSTPLFTLIGSFKVPSVFQYGGSGMSCNNGVMYMSGLTQGNINQATLGSFQVPTRGQIAAGGATATTIKAPVIIPGNIGQGASNSFTYAIGSLVYQGSLYINLGIFYDTAHVQTGWLVKADTALTTFGAPQGMTLDVEPSALLSNYDGPLGNVPTAWQGPMGGPAYVVGGLGLGITSSRSVGNSLAVFNPATASTSASNVAVKQWLNYAYQGSQGTFGDNGLWTRPNVLGQISGTTLTITQITLQGFKVTRGATVKWAGGTDTITALGTSTGGTGTVTLGSSHTAAANTPIWISNTAVAPQSGASTGGDDLASTYDGPVGNVFFPSGTRSWVFANVHHYGPEAPAGNSNCDVGASSSNDPRRVQLYYYDGAAVIANRNAGNAISKVTPYAIADFPNWQSLFGSCPGVISPGSENGWICVDPVTNIAYGSANGMGGSNLTIYAWDVGTGIQASYTTAFPATQNPIVDDGNWVRGKSEGLNWTDPQTTAGYAWPTMTTFDGSHYIDSVAHRKGFAANHSVSVVVRNSAAPSGLEIELLLRFQITPGNARGYELDWVNSSNELNIVRWNGPGGTAGGGAGVAFDIMGTYTSGVSMQDGDVLEGFIQGSIITAYCTPAATGVRKLIATLDAQAWATIHGGAYFSDGQPGFGGWNETGSSNNKLGIKSFSAASI